MAVITQGRKQWVVSTKTLLGWKRFERESTVAAEITGQDHAGGLIVRVGERPVRWRILGKRIEDLG